MNAKKRIALLLAVLLVLSVFAGCSGGTPESETETPTEEPETTEAVPEVDYEAMYNAAVEKIYGTLRDRYDPDTVVCTIDGQDITWGMYNYFIADELMNMVYYTGDLPADFNEILTETTTLNEYFNKSVRAKAVYYAVANQLPERLNLDVSGDIKTAIDEYWNGLLERYNSEEALLEAMSEEALTKDLLFFFLGANEGLNAVQKALYDENSMTDEDVIAWGTEKGYVHTKHILYSFYNKDGTERSEEDKAAQKTRADEVRAELAALAEDPAALEARFDEIMTAETEDDAALATFPDGYTFTEGAMVKEFSDAAFALGDYGLSEVVETSYGYHILLRLPLSADGMTMDQNSSTGAYMTLRETAANDKFSADVAKWIDEAKIEWQIPELENIDFNALFGIVPGAGAEE